MAKNVEAEQSRKHPEQPVIFGPKRLKIDPGQSDMVNNTLYHPCISYTVFWPEERRELPFLAIALNPIPIDCFDWFNYHMS